MAAISLKAIGPTTTEVSLFFACRSYDEHVSSGGQFSEAIQFPIQIQISKPPQELSSPAVMVLTAVVPLTPASVTPEEISTTFFVAAPPLSADELQIKDRAK